MKRKRIFLRIAFASGLMAGVILLIVGSFSLQGYFHSMEQLAKEVAQCESTVGCMYCLRPDDSGQRIAATIELAGGAISLLASLFCFLKWKQSKNKLQRP